MRYWVVLWLVAAVALLSACSAATSGTVAPRPASDAVSSSHVAKHAIAAAGVPKPVRSAAPVNPSPAARPKPVNACAHNGDAQLVIVDIRKQHAWMCAHHTAVFETGVTTGMVGQWTNTPTGYYRIQGRTTNTVLTLNTGARYNVRYWIPFDGPLFGFHDASWQTFPYGSSKYKTAGSHGCVHMPLAAMKFLYRWAAEPTSVHIF